VYYLSLISSAKDLKNGIKILQKLGLIETLGITLNEKILQLLTYGCATLTCVTGIHGLNLPNDESNSLDPAIREALIFSEAECNGPIIASALSIIEKLKVEIDDRIELLLTPIELSGIGLIGLLERDEVRADGRV